MNSNRRLAQVILRVAALPDGVHVVERMLDALVQRTETEAASERVLKAARRSA